jgi:hypothetical protein
MHMTLLPLASEEVSRACLEEDVPLFNATDLLDAKDRIETAMRRKARAPFNPLVFNSNLLVCYLHVQPISELCVLLQELGVAKLALRDDVLRYKKLSLKHMVLWGLFQKSNAAIRAHLKTSTPLAIIADLPYDPKYHESLVAEKDVVRRVLSYCLFVPSHSSHALHCLC